MTRNVYLGADLARRSTPPDARLRRSTAPARSTTRSSGPISPSGRSRWRRRSRSRRPTSSVCRRSPTGGSRSPTDGGWPPISAPARRRRDQVRLPRELKKHLGGKYKVAGVQEEFEAELPADTDGNDATGAGPLGGGPIGADLDARLTMRDVILGARAARSRSRRGRSRRATTRTGSRPTSAGVPIIADRGWLSVEAKVKGEEEGEAEQVPLRQHAPRGVRRSDDQGGPGEGADRGEGRLKTKKPVILVGDLNSGLLNPHEVGDGGNSGNDGDQLAFKALKGFGMKDYGTKGEFTCCYGSPLDIGEEPFDHTIDHILGNKALKAKRPRGLRDRQRSERDHPVGPVAFRSRRRRQQAEDRRRSASRSAPQRKGRSFGAAFSASRGGWQLAPFRRGRAASLLAGDAATKLATSSALLPWRMPAGIRPSTPFLIAVWTRRHVGLGGPAPPSRSSRFGPTIPSVPAASSVWQEPQLVANSSLRAAGRSAGTLSGEALGVALLRDRPDRDRDGEGHEEELRRRGSCAWSSLIAPALPGRGRILPGRRPSGPAPAVSGDRLDEPLAVGDAHPPQPALTAARLRPADRAAMLDQVHVQLVGVGRLGDREHLVVGLLEGGLSAGTGRAGRRPCGHACRPGSRAGRRRRSSRRRRSCGRRRGAPSGSRSRPARGTASSQSRSGSGPSSRRTSWIRGAFVFASPPGRIASITSSVGASRIAAQSPKRVAQPAIGDVAVVVAIRTRRARQHHVLLSAPSRRPPARSHPRGAAQSPAARR